MRLENPNIAQELMKKPGKSIRASSTKLIHAP